MSESQLDTCRVIAVGLTDSQGLEDRLSEQLGDVSVRTAETAMEALDALAAADQVDCVVSAEELPDSDGLTLLRRVRERHPEMPFVLSPTDGDEALATDALAADVTDYVPLTATGAVAILANSVAEAVEKRQTERQLATRRRLYETVVDASHGGTVTLDADGNVVSANERATDILGVSGGELTGRPFDDTGCEVTDLDGEPIPTAELPFVTVVETGEPIRDCRLAITTPEGRRRFLSVNGVPVTADGEMTEVVFSIEDITAQIQREEALDQNQTRLRALFDESADPVFVHDANGTILDVSNQATRSLGYSRTDLVGMSVCDIEADADRRELFELWDSIPLDETATYEGRHERADGSEFPVEAHINRVDIDGEKRFICHARDVSDQHRARDRLEREHDLFTRTEQMANIGAWELVVESDTVYWTDQAREIHGVSEDYEPTVEEAVAFYHPDDRATIEQALDRVVEAGEPYDEQARLLTADGDLRWVRTIGEPYETDGEVTHVRGTIQDITDHKEHRRELEIYERALNTAGDAIYQLDPDGNFVMVNDVVTELTGYPRDELLGEHASKVLTSDGAQLGETVVRELVTSESRGVVTQEFDVRTAEGDHITAESRITALYENGSFRGTIGVTRDVTERRSMEQEIRDQNRNLETLLANIPTILFEMDADGEFVRVRGQGIEALASGPENFEGRSAFEVFDEEPVITANTERALAGEQVHDVFEYQGVVFEVWFEPVLVDGEVERVIGTAMDVTERQEHEQTVSDLHDVTRDLLGATTTADVAEVVFEGAVDILDLDMVTVLLYDDSSGGLVPVEYTESIEQALEGVPSVWPEESDAWTAFQQGVLVSKSQLDGQSDALWTVDEAGAGSFLPLAGYGVLMVGASEPSALDGGTLDLADTLAATAEAALARVDRERALQERERELREEKAFVDGLIDSLPDIMYAIDESGQFIRWNDRLLSVTGYSEAEIEELNPTDLVPDEQQPTVVDQFDRVKDGSTVRAAVDLQTADGDRIPYEFTSAPVVRNGSVEGVVGIGRDISGQKAHEQTLTALHNVTRELLRAEANSTIGEHVVTAAERSLDFDGVAVYLFDETDNVLRPVAYSDRTRELVGEVPTFGPGDAIAWDVFVDGEARIYDDVRQDPEAYNPDTPFRTELLIPLGDQGVFVAGKTTPDAMSDRTLELAQILAANCEAALTRTERERSLRERDRELKEQNARLEQLKEINEKIRGIDHALVGAETRTEIEAIVCERLAAVDRFRFAWVGSLDLVDDAVVPESWDGHERGYLDSITTALSDAEPAARAARTGDPVVVDTVAENLRSEPWRKEALSRDLLSVAAVPLVYDGVTYGVVTVYADQPEAFTEMARGVLAELGETVAHALNAVERKRALLSESQIELEFELPTGSTALSELVADLGCRLTVESVLPQADGTALAYVSTDADDVDAIREATSRFVTIDRVREITDTGDSSRLELRLTGGSIVTTLAEHGGRLERMAADGERIRIVASLPETADSRAFIEMFLEKYAGAELYARRRRTLEPASETGPRSPLERLTPRQTEAIQVAYYSGFFEWPRECTGEEIAETLDVSPPTFLEHLRRAEGKLVDSIVENATAHKPTERSVETPK